MADHFRRHSSEESDLISRDSELADLVRIDYKNRTMEQCNRAIALLTLQAETLNKFKSQNYYIPWLKVPNIEKHLTSFSKTKNILTRNSTNQYKSRQNQRANRNINPNEAYYELKRLMERRADLYTTQRGLWKQAKKGYSVRSEMNQITQKLSEVNHSINVIIGNLSANKGNHSCYKLAVEFLTSEIERCERQIQKWSRKIDDVETGRSRWLRADGANDNDSSFAYMYIERQREKIRRMNEQLRRIENLDR